MSCWKIMFGSQQRQFHLCFVAVFSNISQINHEHEEFSALHKEVKPLHNRLINQVMLVFFVFSVRSFCEQKYFLSAAAATMSVPTMYVAFPRSLVIIVHNELHLRCILAALDKLKLVD